MPRDLATGLANNKQTQVVHVSQPNNQPMQVAVLPDFNAVDLVILRFSRLMTERRERQFGTNPPSPLQ
jgi:hypothetical protein